MSVKEIKKKFLGSNYSAIFWECFQRFGRSLKNPIGSEKLSLSCDNLLQLMLESSANLETVLELITLLPKEIDFGVHGRVCHFAPLLKIFENIMEPKETFSGNVDFFQMHTSESLTTKFLENIWASTNYKYIIVYHPEGKLSLSPKKFFIGQGLRILKMNDRTPIPMTYISSDTSHILQDRLEENSRGNFLIVQTGFSELPIYHIYQSLFNFYHFPSHKFPKTAEKFFFYLFYIKFHESPLLTKLFGPCTNIIQDYM